MFLLFCLQRYELPRQIQKKKNKEKLTPLTFLYYPESRDGSVPMTQPMTQPMTHKIFRSLFDKISF